MELMLRVTLDTNTIDHRERIEAACAGRDVDLAYTTVTSREAEGTTRAVTPNVTETLVLDESRLDEAVLGGERAASLLDAILRVIGAGSFPPPGHRDQLTIRERRQLRDAMILE